MDCKRLCILVGATCIYIVAGTFLFSSLEMAHEEQNIDSLTHKLDNFLANHTCINTSDLLYILDTIETQSKQGTRLARHVISNSTRRNRWDYTGSLSYAVTLITTIGYGHLAPDTTSCKIISVFYALFGIPLTLVMLKEIGEKLNHASKCLYKVKCFKRAWLNKLLGVSIVTLLGLTIVIILPSVMFIYVEGWSMTEALYYCFITLSTVGFGDFVPSGGSLVQSGYYKPYIVFIYVWILFGLVNVSLFITAMADAMVNNARVVEKHTLTKLEAEIKRMRLELSRHRRHTCSFVDDSDGKAIETKSHNTTLLRVHRFISSVECVDGNTVVEGTCDLDQTQTENSTCPYLVDKVERNTGIRGARDMGSAHDEDKTCAPFVGRLEEIKGIGGPRNMDSARNADKTGSPLVVGLDEIKSIGGTGTMDSARNADKTGSQLVVGLDEIKSIGGTGTMDSARNADKTGPPLVDSLEDNNGIGGTGTMDNEHNAEKTCSSFLGGLDGNIGIGGT